MLGYQLQKLGVPFVEPRVLCLIFPHGGQIWSSKWNATPVECPVGPPGHLVACAMLDSMVLAARDLEIALMKQSRQYARYRREQNPNLVFMDMKPPVTQGVDLLLQPIKAIVEEVVHDEGKVVLDRPCSFAPDKVIACEGTPLSVIHHDSDALWLETRRDCCLANRFPRFAM